MTPMVVPAASQLLKQFIKAAQELTAPPTSQDKHLSSLTSDPRYDRALSGLKVLAHHHPDLLVDSLAKWRNDATTNDLRYNYSNGDTITPEGVYKRAATEYLFMEVGSQLLGEFSEKTNSRDIDAFYGSLQHVAFLWVLQPESFVPQGDLVDVRQQVSASGGRLLGALSQRRLHDITTQFIKEVKERLDAKDSTSRAQIYKLCQGMKNVLLGFENDKKLQEATWFLKIMSPLQYMATNKKSQVHHMLCDVLTDVLSPLIHKDVPRSCRRLNSLALDEWHAQVLRMYRDLSAWVNKQSKHYQSGYPLVVTLAGLLEDGSHRTVVDGLVDVVVKVMKQKDYRGVGVSCLTQLIYSYLIRYHLVLDKGSMAHWLDRCIQPIMMVVKKGNMGGAEMQDVLWKLGELVPEYTITNVILELLQLDNLDCQILALRALYHMAVNTAPCLGSSATGVGGAGGRTFWSGSSSRTMLLKMPSTKQSREVLNMIHQGQHPWEVRGVAHLLPRIISTLSQLITSFHQNFGSALSYNLDYTPVKERQGALLMYSWAFRLLPYVKLEQWSNTKIISLLPAYIVHAEGSIRQSVRDALQGILMATGELRNTIIMGVAAFIVGMPDDGHERTAQAVRESLTLLRTLMSTWLDVLKEHGAPGVRDKEEGVPTPPHSKALRLDIAQLEGMMVCLLCSYDLAIRREALDVLRLGRELDMELREARIRGPRRLGQAAWTQTHSPSSSHQLAFVSDTSVTLRDIDEEATDWGEDGNELYVMDVIDESGDDLVLRSYWDIGDRSDLWRQYMRVPSNVSFLSIVLSREDKDDFVKLRLARILAELVSLCLVLCPETMTVTQQEVGSKLARMGTLRDNQGRLLGSTEATGAGELRRMETWSNLVVVASVCGPRSGGGLRAGRGSNSVSIPELFRLLVSSLTTASPTQQQQYLLALGLCHTGYWSVLLEEVATTMEEYSRGSKAKTKGLRIEEARKFVANIFRVVASSTPADAMDQYPAMQQRLIDFVRETYAYLEDLRRSPDKFLEMSQVAYCLCSVAGHLRTEVTLSSPLALKPQSSVALSTQSIGSIRGSIEGSVHSTVANGGMLSRGLEPMALFRKQLYEMFSDWCDGGKASTGRWLDECMRQVLTDYEGFKDLKGELELSVDFLDHAARLGMAAVLKGPVFDPDVRRAQGPVFSWIDRLFRGSPARAPTLGPPKPWVARQALHNLLENNLDLFGVCVDKCYSPDPQVASGYFQVVSELYALHPIHCDAHVVLSLVLYKLVDSKAEVREDALNMLQMLGRREWSPTGGDNLTKDRSLTQIPMTGDLGGLVLGGIQGAQSSGDEPVLLLGSLQDSYQQFQYSVSANLARDHPELSEHVCEEMMTRQLDCVDQVIQHPVLTSLAPWMENLSISTHWKGTWGERLLKSMYYVTLRHGSQLPQEIEKLWGTLAINKKNIAPILDFLLSLGIHMAYQEVSAMLEFLSVTKRISLYLARVSPQQTVDYLVEEVLRQVEEEENGEASQPSSSGAPLDFMSLVQGTRAGFPGEDEVLAGPPPRSVRDSSRSGRSVDLARRVVSKTDSETSRSSSSTLVPSLMADLLAGLPRPMSISKLEASSEPLAQQQALRSSPMNEPVSPTLRALVTRPELAMCLVSEVALELEVDVRANLAVLAHMAVVSQDHEELLVAQHSQQLVTNMVYLLATCQQERRQETDAEEAAALVKRLQSSQAKRLWVYEDVHLGGGGGGGGVNLPSVQALNQLVQGILKALHFEEDLREQWASLALQWALTARNRHIACRSLQIYRALRPVLSHSVCQRLLMAMHQCLDAGTTFGQEVALEVIHTLQALVESSPPNKILLYPQLFWTCVALLHTNYVHIYHHALNLMEVMLSRMPLHTSTAQDLLLATVPVEKLWEILPWMNRSVKGLHDYQSSSSSAPRPWVVGEALKGRPDGPSPAPSPVLGSSGEQCSKILAIQQLLWKGLLLSETPLQCVNILTLLARSLADVGRRRRRQESGAGAGRLSPVVPFTSTSPPLSMPHHHVCHSSYASHKKGSSAPRTSHPGPISPISSAPPSPRLQPVSRAASSPNPFLPPMVTSPPLIQRRSHIPSASPSYQDQRHSLDNPLESKTPSFSPIPDDHTSPKASRPRTTSHPNSSWEVRSSGSLCSAARHLDILRQDIYDALMGAWQGQVLVSLSGMLPFYCLVVAAPESATTGALIGPLQDCLLALCEACDAYGWNKLADRIKALLEATHSNLPYLLSALAFQFTHHFFPHFSHWFLEKAMAVLMMPAASRLHRHLLVLLKCIFEVPGLKLGPEAVKLVVNSSLFHPLVTLAQVMPGPEALDTLEGLIQYGSQTKEEDMGSTGDEAAQVDVMELVKGCFPVVDLAAVLRQVLQSFEMDEANPMSQRVMPFLAPRGAEEGAI